MEFPHITSPLTLSAIKGFLYQLHKSKHVSFQSHRSRTLGLLTHFIRASFFSTFISQNNACEVSWGPLIRQWLQHDPVLPAVAKQHPPPTSHSVSLDNLGNTSVSSLAQKKLIHFSHSLPLSGGKAQCTIFVNEREGGTEAGWNTEGVSLLMFSWCMLELTVKKRKQTMKACCKLQLWDWYQSWRKDVSSIIADTVFHLGETLKGH